MKRERMEEKEGDGDGDGGWKKRGRKRKRKRKERESCLDAAGHLPRYTYIHPYIQYGLVTALSSFFLNASPK